MKIWVDADACPKAVKDLVFRASARLGLPVCLVANRPLSLPASPLVTLVQVPKLSDAADSHIARHVAPGDLVITEKDPRGSRRALALAEETRARRTEESHLGCARRESGCWLA